MKIIEHRTPTKQKRSTDPPPQFDSSDLGSPHKVWALLCEKDEKLSRDPHVFCRQKKINAKMRAMLLDWLMDVCADKQLHRETFHLCIDYIDRFIALNDQQIQPQRLQLFGSTALVIASKVEEIYPPKIAEIAEYTDGCCSESDIRGTEEIMLEKLDWTCYPMTAVHWLALYMQLMSTDEVATAQRGHIYPDQRCTVPKLMRGEFVRMASILDLVMLDSGCLHFRYSELATAVVLCCYEPENLICQLTGFSPDKVRDARSYIDPFVRVFDLNEPTGTAVPCLADVPHVDRHNIQTYSQKCLEHLESVQQNRKETELHRKEVDLRVAARVRKRKFGTEMNL